MVEQKVVISKDLKADLQAFLAALNYDKLFILTDTNTQEKCYPLIQDVPAIKEAPVITVDAGDTHKGWRLCRISGCAFPMKGLPVTRCW